MGRRRKHKRDQGTVEMNLAAMLDMAFQLLTFFILTFRPAPIEGQLALHMPPPVPQTKVEASTVNKSDPGDLAQLDLDTLHLQVTADDSGDVGTVSVEKAPAVRGPVSGETLLALEKKLQTILGIQHVPYDRVQIAVDGKLRYGELMKIIDVCSHQKRSDGEYIKKISFTEL
jgi:biopolymer transport protein ExbD